MIKEYKIDEKDFSLNLNFNEESNHFENVFLADKGLSKEKKKILNEICVLFSKCKPQELYEHLIIRVENSIRNFDEEIYDRVILSSEKNNELKSLNIIFRKFLNKFCQKSLLEKINFESLKPSGEWIYLNEKKKLTLVEKHINDFIKKNYNGIEFSILRIERHSEVFICILSETPVDIKAEFCLDVEIYLKKNLEESLTVYLETMTDANKLRRLKL